MEIRKYQARTVKEAFARAQQELGNDAVLIHQREVAVASPGGRGMRRMVEVTVGLDARQADEVDVRPFFPAAGRREPNRNEPNRRAAQPRAQAPVAAGPADDSEYDSLRREIQYIRKMLHRQGASSERQPEALQIWHNVLLESGLEPELVEGALFGLEDVLTQSALQHPEMVAATLRQRLLSMLQPGTGTLQPGQPGNPLVFVLVGPTGVGKTTTIAKLAAHYSLRERVPIALITADTFRIGAINQLRIYSELTRSPLEVAYTPSDLSAYIRKHQNKAMIFIDTPGRSPADHVQLESLRGFIDVLDSFHMQIAVSAGTQFADARRIVQRFSVARPHGLILTKLDETSQYGATISLMKSTNLPVSYFTTGQRVPEDIVVADRGALLSVLLKTAADKAQSALAGAAAAPVMPPAAAPLQNAAATPLAL